jgi:hypothetical protein
LYDLIVVPVHYRIIALMRFILFWLLRPLMRYEPYRNPRNVGYLGYWTLFGAVIVFRRMNGQRQYLW